MLLLDTESSERTPPTVAAAADLTAENAADGAQFLPSSSTIPNQRDDDCDETLPGHWKWLKIPVTLWLVFHLSAIVIFPASIPVPGVGLLSVLSTRLFAHYMEALYMVQGHRFFAPEPGPGLLVEYTLDYADGREVKRVFPHRDIQPRLLYHRYFMLSERAQDVDDPDSWFRMYARHLAWWYGGDRVTLHRVIHRLPTPSDVIAGKSLTDAEFFLREVLGSWSRTELELEP